MEHIIKQYPIIEFSKNLLEKIKIPLFILESPYKWNSFYDRELRATIWKDMPDRFQAFQEDLQNITSKSIITTISDSYCCDYIFIKIPDSENLIFIGPFSYEKITNNRILQIQELNNIPDALMNYMQIYYSSLSYISDERWIKGTALLLAQDLWKQEEIHVTHLRLEYEKNISYYEQITDPSSAAKADIEQRYDYEKHFMNCISDGNMEKLSKFSDNNVFHPLKQRFPDTIRDMKNSAIIMNTLCRKAAQAGSVHPIYLDELSRKYAIQIEESTSTSQIHKITSEMPRKYCMLVMSHSLKHYTKPIQDVINMITLDLTEDLSLSSIANALGINSSYLSNLFKKETGTTLTAYVNKKRIEKSIFLLNTTLDSIQDIACSCGISDVNYFTKIFKKEMGMTPTEYRTMIRK